jgi:HEAT repeat protein
MRKLNPNLLYAALGLLVVLVVVRFLLAGHREESAEELTEMALHAADPVDQEQAATRLEALAVKAPYTGPRNATQPFLARLLKESENPGVRAAGMRALATIWDYECMPTMLDLLQDPSPQVRDMAALSVAKLIDVRLDASAPPEQRAAAIKRLRGMWETFQARTLKSWQQRLEAKDKKP